MCVREQNIVEEPLIINYLDAYDKRWDTLARLKIVKLQGARDTRKRVLQSLFTKSPT